MGRLTANSVGNRVADYFITDAGATSGGCQKYEQQST